MSEVKIVFFSSVTNNTKKLVEKLGFPAERIPLYAKEEPLFVDYDYVLFVPTYGGGSFNTAVPKQVIKFLNVEENRKHCIGVVTSGNMNFGAAYGRAGDVVSSKLKVPMLYRFELRGFDTDVKALKDGLTKYVDDIENGSIDLESFKN